MRKWTLHTTSPSMENIWNRSCPSSSLHVYSPLMQDARRRIRRKIGIDISVRIRVLKCYIWSTLLYGCETWKICVDMMKKLEALDIWFYQRMLWISWKDRLTNEVVYRRMNTHTSLLIAIVLRQLSFLEHVIQKDDLEGLVVTGFVDSKRARDRPMETFLTYISKMMIKSPLEKKKDVCSTMCAHSNLRLSIGYAMMMMMTC